MRLSAGVIGDTFSPNFGPIPAKRNHEGVFDVGVALLTFALLGLSRKRASCPLKDCGGSSTCNFNVGLFEASRLLDIEGELELHIGIAGRSAGMFSPDDVLAASISVCCATENDVKD